MSIPDFVEDVLQELPPSVHYTLAALVEGSTTKTNINQQRYREKTSRRNQQFIYNGIALQLFRDITALEGVKK